MVGKTHPVELQRFGHATLGKAPMFSMCVNNNMLHAGVAARDWQPLSLLNCCVVSIIVGQGSTAVC